MYDVIINTYTRTELAHQNGSHVPKRGYNTAKATSSVSKYILLKTFSKTVLGLFSSHLRL